MEGEMRTPIVAILNPFHNGPEWMWHMIIGIIRLLEAVVNVATLSVITPFISTRLIDWRMRVMYNDMMQEMRERSES